MKAVVIGAGRIGCGLAGQLLRESGHEVVFLARDPVFVGYLNRVGGYQVRLVEGTRSHMIPVGGVRGILTSDARAACDELATADVIMTAVGAPALKSIAPLLAEGLRDRQSPVNVLALENVVDSGGLLKRFTAEHLPQGHDLDRHGFCSTLVTRIVAQRAGDPHSDGSITFVGDSPTTLAVDGNSLRAQLPDIHGLVVTHDFAAWMDRKLYLFSAGHATCAYLGYLKGYRFIHSAIRDPEIRAMVLEASVSKVPAIALPTAAANDFAVKYQAKADPMAFSSPCSAMSAFTDGVRTAVERPCTVRMVNSSQGAEAKASRNDTTLRRTSAAISARFVPTRSASHPAAGLRASFTNPSTASKTPVSASESPRLRA